MPSFHFLDAALKISIIATVSESASPDIAPKINKNQDTNGKNLTELVCFSSGV